MNLVFFILEASLVCKMGTVKQNSCLTIDRFFRDILMIYEHLDRIHKSRLNGNYFCPNKIAVFAHKT